MKLSVCVGDSTACNAPYGSSMMRAFNLVEGFFSKLARSVLRHIRRFGGEARAPRRRARRRWLGERPGLKTS
jgi:hypothetical protein